MIQYSILTSIYSYSCCFTLFQLSSSIAPACLSFFFSSSSHLLSSTSHLPPHLPAHSLSSWLPSSFLSFSSSLPPVPTLFLLSPFFLSASPHFFHSHLFFHNQYCSYPLFPYFIPYSSLFLPLNFSAPPQSPHLASFNETWCNQNLLQACCRTSDISST